VIGGDTGDRKSASVPYMYSGKSRFVWELTVVIVTKDIGAIPLFIFIR
jgi:hypothetical protein